MNDLARTMLTVIVAAALAGGVYLTRPRPVVDARFSDQGELLFPGFTDPAAARSLQVLSYDQTKASILPFKVEFDGKRWVIPSHHNYPADAQSKMGQAAAAFVGVRKEQVVSDRAADHEALGVLAPDDAAAPLSGRGTRVTIKGEGGAVLADLIVGSATPPVTDESGAQVNRRYVRLPDKNRVYAARFDKTISTSMSDWVETDLLQLTGQRITRYLVDRYEIDETAGTKMQIERVSLSRGSGIDVSPTDPTGPALGGWTMQAEPGGPPATGESLNTFRVEEAVGALAGLKIVGVRPKPPVLAKWFAGEVQQISQGDVLDLQSRGFFLTQSGEFVANEGEVSAGCTDGVVYTLHFGEVLFGSGEALSAGTDALGSQASENDANAEGGTEARYAFVRVSYDESLIPEPRKPQAPSEPTNAEPAQEPEPAPGGAEPEQPASADASPDAPSAEPAKDPVQLEYEAAVAERAQKIEAGKKRAAALSRRFADWYYVIDGASFGKLRPTRAELVQQNPPSDPTAPATPMMLPVPAGQ